MIPLCRWCLWCWLPCVRCLALPLRLLCVCVPVGLSHEFLVYKAVLGIPKVSEVLKVP